MGKHGLLGVVSFAPRRVLCLISLSTRLGRGGRRKVVRSDLIKGGVTLVFRGADAEAQYSFRMTTRSLNVRIACLSPDNSRVKGGRDVPSATHILKHVFSKVRCHKCKRRVIRRLTGCTKIPI